MMRRVAAVIKVALAPRLSRQQEIVWTIRAAVALAVVVFIVILLVRFGVLSSDNAPIAAALIALTGVVLTQAVNTRIAQSNQLKQQELETDRAQTQQELEAERVREDALQKYFERIGELLLEKGLRQSSKERSSQKHSDQDHEDVQLVARGQTLTVLQVLNPDRKRLLVQFFI